MWLIIIDNRKFLPPQTKQHNGKWLPLPLKGIFVKILDLAGLVLDLGLGLFIIVGG
jgi:hypothetical protein